MPGKILLESSICPIRIPKHSPWASLLPGEIFSSSDTRFYGPRSLTPLEDAQTQSLNAREQEQQPAFTET